MEALKGHEVLIITMGVTAPQDQQSKLIEAAAEADVPFILPNEWGGDGLNVEVANDTLLGPGRSAIRHQIEKLGKSWIAVVTGYWYEFSLSGGVERYGFDFENRKVVFVDDGEARIPTSTWPQVGRAVASVMNHLEKFKNNYVYIASFVINQREMLESVKRVSGTDDWKVEHQNHKERYDSGISDLKQGNLEGFARAMYTRMFYPDGSGNYAEQRGLHNDMLGLPKEDLDEATKVALEMVRSASTTFGKKYGGVTAT